MVKMFSYSSALVSILILSSCQNNSVKNSDALFQSLPASVTGIDFNNKITPSDSINILSYEYLYNGGGVGIGDFNNDSLPDIFFSGQMVESRLYLNRGNFKFDDVTKKSGIVTKNIWAYGVSVIDINQDGLMDIYLCNGGIKNIHKDFSPNRLYINNGDMTFHEAAKEYGIDALGESIQATFLDYDHDGDLDMYILRGGGFEKSAITPFPILRDGSSRNTDRLYRNDHDEKLRHPVFTDVSKEAGILLEGFGLGVSVLDVNEDSWPDLYVTNDYLSKDHLYVNNRNGTFTDRVDQYLKHTSHFAMGNDVGNINNDGKLDLLAVDMLPEVNYDRKLMFGPNQYDKFYYAVGQGYGFQYMRNTLQLNNGDGSFSEIAQLAGIAKTSWSWAPLIADFDNDGFQDIVITNGYGKDVTNLDYVKFNQPSFELTREQRVQKLLDRPPIMDFNYAYKNNHDNTFTKVSTAWGFDEKSISSGMAYADFDRDGDLDLVVNNVDKEAFVFKNTTSEKSPTGHNFLRVKLQGGKQNNAGAGALVVLRYPNAEQVRFATPVHGFESSVENILHFGLGDQSTLDTLMVKWGDGTITTIASPKVNQVITVAYDKGTSDTERTPPAAATLMTTTNKLPIRHVENEYNDFLIQPLLQHKLSQDGPGIAVGDINNDGLEDVFIGSAYRLPAHLAIQNSKGGFDVKEFTDGYEGEDLGALFFDADNDGDLDLYVAMGSVEFYAGHEFYQDRLYLNDGKGNLKRATNALPKMTTSKSAVVAGDYDNDGDLDLFIGGRVVPEKYPNAPVSYLLNNNKGIFTDVTDAVAPGLREIGMVTSTLWSDYDNDGKLDLVIAGEVMPIKIFRNDGAKLTDVTGACGLADTDGLWNSIVAGDFDNDGDMDYVAGNLGLNGPMTSSTKEPIEIHYADFDRNGSIDPITGYYENGVLYPIHPLDILASRLPSLKKTILHHKDYAASSMTDVIGMMPKGESKTLYCKTLKSSLIKNAGNGKFEIIPLPQQAQLSPVYGMLAEDINGDGNLDLLAVGNSYGQEVVYGRYDALNGVTLLGKGNGDFNYLANSRSGFNVKGDAKGLARIETKNGSMIVATQNNDSVRSFILKKPISASIIKAKQNECYAILHLKGQKKRKVDLGFGTSYLSQSSRTILINDAVESVELFDATGRSSRAIKFIKSASR